MSRSFGRRSFGVDGGMQFIFRFDKVWFACVCHCPPWRASCVQNHGEEVAQQP